MNIFNTKIDIGLGHSVRVLHASDTHLTYADMRDGERKVTLAEQRIYEFPQAEEVLAKLGELSKERNQPIMHTGDLLDFVSLANMEAAKAFTDEHDLFLATGNHEFSLYLGEAKEDATYRNQSLDKVQACFKNNIRMSARVIDGVKFVALDNGYYTFEPEQLEFLKQEVKEGLPIVMMFHTPLYDRDLYENEMSHSPCGYLVGVPEELMRCYTPDRYEQQLPDAVTLEVMEYIANEPLIKAILAGHLHYNYEGTLAGRIPQIITGCEDIRLVEFV